MFLQQLFARCICVLCACCVVCARAACVCLCCAYIVRVGTVLCVVGCIFYFVYFYLFILFVLFLFICQTFFCYSWHEHSVWSASHLPCIYASLSLSLSLSKIRKCNGFDWLRDVLKLRLNRLTNRVPSFYFSRPIKKLKRGGYCHPRGSNDKSGTFFKTGQSRHLSF